MQMMGALSQTEEPDGEVIDTEVEEMSPLTGYSPEMLQGMVAKAQRPNDSMAAAYSKMADALRASRGPDKSQMFLSLAAALGKPTRTGSFGETVGNAAEALGAYRGARSEARQKGDLGLAELEYKYAAQQDEATQKQGLEALKLLAKGKTGKLTEDSDQRLRLGLARNAFPGVSDEELVLGNKLYSPEVQKRMEGIYAAKAGYPPEDEDPVVSSSAPPRVTSPGDAAKYPNSPTVVSPDGIVRTNPFYKGG